MKGRELTPQLSQSSILSLADSHTEFFDACEVLLSASSSENEGSEEEEESCTSEITTSLSEEVLDLRGAERYQRGARRACGCGVWVGRGIAFACGSRTHEDQSLVVMGGLMALGADASMTPELRKSKPQAGKYSRSSSGWRARLRLGAGLCSYGPGRPTNRPDREQKVPLFFGTRD